MTNRRYRILFWFILLFSLVIRLAPLLGNNVLFAGDQARDALAVKELLVDRQFPLVGPPTSLFGTYDGALWYYFLAIGYALFSLHPFGAVLLVLVISVATTGILMEKIKKELSPEVGLLSGLTLSGVWDFFMLTRSAAPPFVVVFMTLILILILVDMLAGKNRVLLAATLVGLGMHVEVAATIVPFLLFLSVTGWMFLRRRLSLVSFFLGVAAIAVSFLPHFVFEIQTNFSQTRAVVAEFRKPGGSFAASSAQQMTLSLSHAVARGVFPANRALSVFAFSAVALLAIRHRNRFVARFIGLTVLFIFLAWGFFSTNQLWNYWHTLAIAPLVFVAFLLGSITLGGRLGTILIAAVVAVQLATFTTRLGEWNRTSTTDLRLLRHELQRIDEIYQTANGRQFSFRNNLATMYDTSFSYLFWWYGRTHYGYLPCRFIKWGSIVLSASWEEPCGAEPLLFQAKDSP